jgi:hypothetical protein
MSAHRAAAGFIAIVVLALEFAWVRRFVQSPWSLLGFDFLAMDLGVLGMADILLFGLYLSVAHPGRHGPLLLDFECYSGPG